MSTIHKRFRRIVTHTTVPVSIRRFYTGGYAHTEKNKLTTNHQTHRVAFESHFSSYVNYFI